MSQINNSILESWPSLKEDFESFLSDTDAWVITELKKARTAKNWKKVDTILDVMEFVHGISHTH